MKGNGKCFFSILFRKPFFIIISIARMGKNLYTDIEMNFVKFGIM